MSDQATTLNVDYHAFLPPLQIRNKVTQAWWHTPAIEASPENLKRPCLKNKESNKIYWRNL
jgi:hypothetical protein